MSEFFCNARRWAFAMLVSTMALPAIAADSFLEPELAFPISAKAIDRQNIELRFDVVPGYHLYRERFNARAEPADVVLGELQIPRGLPDFDIALNKQVEIFKNAVTLILPLTQAPQSEFKLIVGNQGCADKGLCYPPMERALKLTPTAAGWTISAMTEAQAEAWKPGLSDSATATEQTGRYAAALQSRSLLAVAGLFLLAGLLLSLTPCVLPMIPILSAIIVGQSGKVSRARGFSLALAYSLGMALVYTAFGMAAGLAGEGLAAALQNAWVLGAFALLLAGLSLSMFGVYELQLPSAMQNRLTEMSGRLKGGQHLGVLLMGGLSALIVGPCVAAPLAGALVYISQTKDVLLGGLALFSMACGMSVPLLLVGLSAGTLLPRAGGWMERVKHFFGVMLLAVALWMVSPVLPAWALIAVAALLLLACAVYLGAFERMEAVTPGRALTKAGGLALAALAGLQLVGLVSGGTSLMQPLQHLVSSGKTGLPAFEANELKFERVADLASLQQVVSQSSQPVLLDFYADWCVACKEFEALTLSDPAVRRQLAGFKLLRADVTANSSADKELLRKYALFGPPAILFMKQDGLELASHRVIGFQDAAAFTQHLLNLMPRLQAAPTKL
jgi:thiol:disulfide interchange protein DsbD